MKTDERQRAMRRFGKPSAALVLALSVVLLLPALPAGAGGNGKISKGDVAAQFESESSPGGAILGRGGPAAGKASPAGWFRGAGGGARFLVGANFLVSGDDAIGDDQAPAVAYGADAGEYVVVWGDWRTQPPAAAIWGQRVSAAGGRFDADFRISEGRSYDPRYGDGEDDHGVAYNSDTGEYLVVWADWRNFNTRKIDIYGQLLSASGDPVGSNFRVSGDGATSKEKNPAVVYNPDAGEFLVVWVDNRDHAARDEDIWGRRVSALGSPLGTEFRVSGNKADSDESTPAVTYNPDADEYLVVWADYRGGYVIWGRRVSAAGIRLGPNLRVTNKPYGESEDAPAVAYNSNAGEYLVVSERDGVGGVVGQRLSATGTRLGPKLRVSGKSASRSYNEDPEVVYSAAVDEYLVVWADGRRMATRGFDVWGQLLSGSGSRLGFNVRLGGNLKPKDQWAPEVALNSETGEYLVVWQDQRNRAAGRGDDIYGVVVAP